MKKRILILLACLIALSLSACCLNHEYSAATCTEPATCAKCGKTKGEAKGHSWSEATCTVPKTCSVCGKTKGEALGHSWTEATCTEAKTCSVCGETEGEALGHAWMSASTSRPKTCTVCGETEGKNLNITWIDPTAFVTSSNNVFCSNDRMCVLNWKKHDLVYAVYEWAEGQEAPEPVSGGTISGSGYDMKQYNCYSHAAVCFTLCCQYSSHNGNFDLYTYDWDGEQLSKTSFTGNKKTELYDIEETDDPTVLKLTSTEVEDDVHYINVETGTVLKGYRAVSTPPNVDEWAHCEPCAALNGYFVKSPDGRWGYADAEGNELAMYVDASTFTANGYALATKDGKTYDLIDNRLRIIEEGIAEGVSANCSGFGQTFRVTREDGAFSFLSLN